MLPRGLFIAGLLVVLMLVIRFYWLSYGDPKPVPVKTPLQSASETIQNKVEGPEKNADRD